MIELKYLSQLRFCLEQKNGNDSLIIWFQSQQKDIFAQKQIYTQFFDVIEEETDQQNNMFCLKTYKKTPLPMSDYSDKFLESEKEKIQRLSRDELLIHLKETNDELENRKQELHDLNQNLEKIVDKQTAELKKLLCQKTNFIVQLGHDLGTPLNPILNLAPVLEKKMNDKKAKEMIGVIKKNSTILYNLVKKTVKFAQVTSNDFQPTYNDFSPHLLINACLEQKKQDLDNRQLCVSNQVDSDLIIKADEHYFKYILDELLTNAIRFSSEHGEIMLTNKTNEQHVTFSIKDTGIGIKKEHLDYVFDEFYKTDESRHDLASNGLGLAIIKIITERLGGKIWIESPGERKGTMVSFALPVHPEINNTESQKKMVREHINESETDNEKNCLMVEKIN